jgi:hypothetical protein
MRSAINDNRTVQLVLLGILALAGGFILLKAGGGSSTPPATSSASTTPGSAPADSSGVASTAAPLDGSTTAGGSSGAAGPAPTVPASLIPGSGMPKSLLASYRRGDGVALLVVRDGGIDDALVHDSLGELNGLPKLSVYATKAKRIARYAWLTQGVDVTELPALVILRPRRLTKGVPTASVSYGFRGAGSVLQAAKDGLYRGPNHLPYHP